MKKRKLATIALASAMMVTSFAACGGNDTNTTASGGDTTTTEAPAATTEATSTETPGTETPTTEKQEAVTPSVDFEDGKFAFAKVNTSKGGSDKSELSVADFKGSKALKAANVDGGNMFIGINVSALLGDKVTDLAEIRIDLGTENADKFAASNGKLYCYTGEENEEKEAGKWSVYLDTQNPKTATFDVSGVGFVAGKDNYIVLSKEEDTSKTKPSDLWIDNITFLDASGATITADTSAEFGNPAGFSSTADRANLLGMTKAVTWEGYQVSGGAWGQAGIAFTDEIKAALVPGSVIEIEFQSTTGNMWIVMNEAAAGWKRVGVGDADGSGQQYARVNNAKNIAQVTYEQIAAVLESDDISTWGSGFQCESDGDWSVSSVKVGQAAPSYALTHAVNFEGFAVKGDAWAQAGATMTDEVKAALVPGSVVEVTYKSESGHMWLVMNEAAAGWKRVGVGDYDGSGQGYIVADGNKAYIPFEMIAEICESDDVSTWGSGFQCESDSAWEVYSVRVGKAEEFTAANYHIDLGASGVKGTGWGQDGVELSADAIAALSTEGAVIDIDYTSATGEIWIVMPDSAAGWKRVGVGDFDGSGAGYALFDGSHCQIPVSMIAEICESSDVSTWGTRIQFEASSDWVVNAASIGIVK